MQKEAGTRNCIAVLTTVTSTQESWQGAKGRHDCTSSKYEIKAIGKIAESHGREKRRGVIYSSKTQREILKREEGKEMKEERGATGVVPHNNFLRLRVRKSYGLRR